MYPSIEVTQKNILKNVILPGGIKLITWLSGKVTEDSTVTNTVGYALYPSNNKTPIMQGYASCVGVELNSDKATLDLLGFIFYGNWKGIVYNFELLMKKEYSESQVNWLSGSDVDQILDILDSYEEEAFDESTPEERGYIWKDSKMYYLNPLTPVFKDVNVN